MDGSCYRSCCGRRPPVAALLPRVCRRVPGYVVSVLSATLLRVCAAASLVGADLPRTVFLPSVFCRPMILKIGADRACGGSGASVRRHQLLQGRVRGEDAQRGPRDGHVQEGAPGAPRVCRANSEA